MLVVDGGGSGSISSGVLFFLEILRLIRFLNCLLASVGVWIGAYLTWLGPSYYGPSVAAVAAFLVCAAGNIINDVVDVDEASFEPCPDTLLGVKRDLICGVYKLEDRLLLVLNAKQIMTFTTDPATLGSANAERGQPSIPG